MKKALVTGAGGFVGCHLNEHLIAEGIEVLGLIHPEHPVKSSEFPKNVKIEKCDIVKKPGLEKVLKGKKFDYVFHLAAFSSPPASFINPRETLQNNILGELNLLEILKKTSPESKILIIGSAEEYGAVSNKDLPADENTPLAPLSPYAVSKVAQDLLGLKYYLSDKLHIVRVRPFNHIGPGQSTAFAVPAFAAQIARLEKEGGGEMLVGNLNSWRDFTDVRDVVRAYLLALTKGKPGDVYNIGSGKLCKVADILKKLLSYTKVGVKVRRDQKLLRDTNAAKIYCDFSKFKKQTGWSPKISISKTLFDTIVYERQKLN